MSSKEKNSTKLYKLNAKLTLVILVLVFAFFTSQILVTSRVGTKSTEIDIIRSEKDTLRLENEILKSKIDEAKSIQNFQDIQKKLDLSEKTVQLLNPQEPDNLALSQ